jgi:hypothetical protein
LRSKLSDDRRSCGNQTDAVNRSGINALHWELRGQGALTLIAACNHTRELQTIASRAASGHFTRSFHQIQRRHEALEGEN